MGQKHDQSQTISGKVKQAYSAWMKGEPFAALAKRVPKLRQADFKKLAGVERWKQAVAKRRAAVKQTNKGES